jgi:hypothetical protein
LVGIAVIIGASEGVTNPSFQWEQVWEKTPDQLGRDMKGRILLKDPQSLKVQNTRQ